MASKFQSEYILSFRIEQIKFGVFLNLIERVIRSVEVTPLPGAPKIIYGVINLSGTTIPIVNFRERLKLKKREAKLSDNIIIVKSSALTFGFFADEVIGLKNIKHVTFATTNQIIPGSDKLIDGITIIEDEMTLIHDVNKFLSLNEINKLSKAIKKI